VVPCRHCHLPVITKEIHNAFCCTGCRFLYSLLASKGAESPELTDSAAWLQARLVLCGFFTVIVMMFSLILYSPDIYTEFIDPEKSGDLSYQAFHGILRLLLLAASTPVIVLLGVPLTRSLFTAGRWHDRAADVLILTGCGSAYILSLIATFFEGPDVYFDTATGVLVLVTFGRSMEMRSRRQAADSFTRLTSWLPQVVHLVTDSGVEDIPAEQLMCSQKVLLRPGEVATIDGTIVSGISRVNESALTGESKAVLKQPGATLFAGTKNNSGTLIIKVDKVPGNRILDRVASLLNNSAARPGRRLQLVHRIAQTLLPTIILLALSCGIFWGWQESDGMRAVEVALSIVLIACPCALGMATPIAVWVGLKRCAKLGLLLRSGRDLENMADLKRIYFDKTGTLSSGELQLDLSFNDLDSESEALKIAVRLAAASNHPISKALVEKTLSNALPIQPFDEVAESVGRGLSSTFNGVMYRLGRKEHVSEAANKALLKNTDEEDSVVYLSKGHSIIASWKISERARASLSTHIAELISLGVEVEILTGDNDRAAKRFANKLDVPVQSSLLPENKYEIVRRSSRERATAMVGDGLNDALALRAATVGVAVSTSIEVAMEASSATLLRPNLEALVGAIRVSRQVQTHIRWNLAWAFTYNCIGLSVAVTGQMKPLWAALAMVASSLTIVLTSAQLNSSSDDLLEN
jgi:heavy metal translocating P-type ATPase